MRYLVICGLLAACQGTPEYGSTTQLSVVVSPTSVDFGHSQIGVATGAATININPAGIQAQDDTVNSITASCPDFSVDAPGLPAEVYRTCTTTCVGAICQQNNLGCQTDDYQNYSFTATFKPTVAGAVSCTVSIVVDGIGRSITLSGTGDPPPVASDIQPASMAFGQVHVGDTSSPIALAVKNTGGAQINVSGLIIPPGYTSSAPGGFGVAVGGSASYPVSCLPGGMGANNASITFQTNDPAHPNVSIPVSCTGIDGALSISPSPATLPTARVGDPKQLVTVSLKNTGSATLTLQSLAIAGDRFAIASGPAANSQIGAGAVAGVMVSYDPSIAGDANGMLTATFDGGKTVVASLAANALVASMAITPDGEVDLGPVCVGQNKSQAFTVLANAPGPFQITVVSMPDVPFSVSAPKLPAAVQGNGASTQMLTVTVAPTSEGHQSGMLSVATDIPNAAPHLVTLTVDAIPAGVTPTPDSLDFGAAPLEATTLGQTVHVSNCDTAAATWSNPRIEGDDATEFAIVAQPDSMSIASTASANWLIVLQAHTAGPKAATFKVDMDDGTTVSVALVGEGLGDGTGGGGGGDDTTTPGKSSYYSCSVGGGTAAWPIGLAFLLLRRRRRRRTCAR